MKKLLTLAMLAVGGTAAFADIDHSQLVNVPLGGTGAIAGQNLSMLEAGESTFGYGVQGGSNNIMADDFTLGAGEIITGVTMYAYLTGGTAPSVTSVSMAIGAAATTSLTSYSFTNTWMSVGGQGVYRVNTGDTGSTGGIRRVQQIDITGLNISPGAGTYFLSWNCVGANFTPPLPNSLAVYGKNAVQSTGGGAFVPVVNGTVGGADMAFIIHTVPEPGTFIAVGAALAALARRRRK